MSGPISGSSTGIEPGVLGANSGGGLGVWGTSNSGNGVYGLSDTGTGIIGESASGKAGEFKGGVTVSGELAVTGNVTATGNVSANGNITAKGKLTANDVLLSGKDCAEEFDAGSAATLEPGTVVALDDCGRIAESAEPYDSRVAGVISGAGEFRPAVVLGVDGTPGEKARIALIGRVYCKVDGSYGEIRIGDLLTTSPTRGHAMRATDQSQAFGAVIGKALAPAARGRDLIPILVTLG